MKTASNDASPASLIQRIREYRQTGARSVEAAIWEQTTTLVEKHVKRLIGPARLQGTGIQDDLRQEAYFIFRGWLQFADLSFEPKQVIQYLNVQLRTRLIDALGRLVDREHRVVAWLDAGCCGETVAVDDLSGELRAIAEMLYAYGLKNWATDGDPSHREFVKRLVERVMNGDLRGNYDLCLKFGISRRRYSRLARLLMRKLRDLFLA
jgi:hypothetical protein